MKIRIGLIFESSVLVDSCDAKAMSKCWFVIDDSHVDRLFISDVHIQIIKTFSPHILDESVPIVLTLNDFVLIPSLNATDVIRDGDVIVVKRRNAFRKRKREEEVSEDDKKQNAKEKRVNKKRVSDPDKSVKKQQQQQTSTTIAQVQKEVDSQPRVSKKSETRNNEESTVQSDHVTPKPHWNRSVVQETPTKDHQKQKPTVVTTPQRTYESREDERTPTLRYTPGSQKKTPASGSYFANLKKQLQSSRGHQRSAEKTPKLKEVQENVSSVIQLSSKSYSDYSLKTGDPEPGEVVAYKILELSAAMTPVISDFKEGKILKFDKGSNTVVLKHLHPPLQVQKQFDQNLQAIDEEETAWQDDSDIYERNWYTMKNVLFIRRDAVSQEELQSL